MFVHIVAIAAITVCKLPEFATENSPPIFYRVFCSKFDFSTISTSRMGETDETRFSYF